MSEYYSLERVRELQREIRSLREEIEKEKAKPVEPYVESSATKMYYAIRKYDSSSMAVKVAMTLIRRGVDSIDELRQRYSDGTLNNIQGIGPKSLEFIEEMLSHATL